MGLRRVHMELRWDGTYSISAVAGSTTSSVSIFSSSFWIRFNNFLMLKKERGGGVFLTVFLTSSVLVFLSFSGFFEKFLMSASIEEILIALWIAETLLTSSWIAE